MDLTEEIRFIEGKFKRLFDRLEGINNLGIIPEVLKMARYSKYEHHLGTVYQINCLLECTNEDIIPDEYRLPLKLSALFLHVGHLPFTYSTERALLLASSMSTEDNDNKAKKYVKKRIYSCIQKVNFDYNEQQKHLEKVFSLENYKILYRYFSCELFLKNWREIRDKYRLKDEQRTTIVKNLIDFDNDGYVYLELADKADFVQRDALYFGTVRLDISPRHLYGQGISGSKPEFYSVDEKKLIESNLDYLRGKFYDSDVIRWFSRLYEKIVAGLIISKNFKIEWLDKLNDSQFKRLITENITPDIKQAKLPKKWTKRAKDLFNSSVVFSPVFKLSDISFERVKNAIDIEYELLQKGASIRGLLIYPFEKGLLLDIDYLGKVRFPTHPNYRQFSVSVFQNDSYIKFTELLKLIQQLSKYCSIIDLGNIKTSHIKSIRLGLFKQFSWTGSSRIDNENVNESIAEAIRDIEETDSYGIGGFMAKFLKSLSSIKTFDELWHNFENHLWLSKIEHLRKNKEHIEDFGIRDDFVEGMVSLPIRLLQYKTTKKYLNDIYKKLLEMVPNIEENQSKGNVFEALCLIDMMQTRKGRFQFFLNGMVVKDPNKPKEKKDENEFDIIELLINREGKAECWIYACSIADDCKQKNEEQLKKLAESIHNIYSDLKIRTRYVKPKDKSKGIWEPMEEETGVGSWN